MLKLYKIVCLAVIALLTGGCKKYLDINSNPSVPQEARAEFLLAPITYQMANGTSQDYRVIGKLTQGLTGSVTDVASVIWERHGFPAGSDVGGVIWRMTYVDLGLNLENMINDALANKKYEYAAIGYAIKAWAYQQATDLHGPIILDEAFTPGMLSFPYHDQDEVYARVREWGALALKYSNMKSPIDQSSKLNDVTGDNIYRGNMLRWRKFVYGLFALQYSHLVNKPEYASRYADSVVKYTDLSFATSAEDATIFFSAAASTDVNPFGPTSGLLTSTYYSRPATNIVDYLTGRTRGDTVITDTTAYIDPRLPRMLVPHTLTRKYVGSVPTKAAVTEVAPLLGYLASSTASLEGHYLFTDNARYPIMTYAQLQFAKAEALYLKGDKMAALAAYRSGILAHMDFVNLYGRTSKSPAPAITPLEIANYLNSSEVAHSPAELTLTDIMGQKYIAQWGWAFLEQWTDIRKYHYDATIFRNYYQLTRTELSADNNGKFAYRFRPRYNSEYVWNQKELEKWQGLDRDYMTKELWFSKP
ncbi:MAG: SusD/RagB family nutrient-binding outer membrane lipoprotein [Arcticibacter sp.]